MCFYRRVAFHIVIAAYGKAILTTWSSAVCSKCATSYALLFYFSLLFSLFFYDFSSCSCLYFSFSVSPSSFYFLSCKPCFPHGKTSTPCSAFVLQLGGILLYRMAWGVWQKKRNRGKQKEAKRWECWPRRTKQADALAEKAFTVPVCVCECMWVIARRVVRSVIQQGTVLSKIRGLLLVPWLLHSASYITYFKRLKFSHTVRTVVVTCLYSRSTCDRRQHLATCIL